MNIYKEVIKSKRPVKRKVVGLENEIKIII